MKPDHLVKILAERGVESRRGSERIVREGKVTVDGLVVTDPAVVVDPRAQRIQIDGEALPQAPRPMYRVMHKPKGCLTSRQDPEGRRTIFDVLPDGPVSLAAVGRLDWGTEGVLLLTNDGELAFRLTHPSYGVTKSYLVKVSGTPEPRKLAQLAQGVDLQDGPTRPAFVDLVRTTGPSSWLHITISEGRNRIVRRMIEHIGHKVLKLKRVAFGGITLRGLGPGAVRELTVGELEHLRRLVREPMAPKLEPNWDLKAAIAEALREAPPEREVQREVPRDEEGRPFRKKGWARPKAKKARPGARKAEKAAEATAARGYRPSKSALSRDARQHGPDARGKAGKTGGKGGKGPKKG